MNVCVLVYDGHAVFEWATLAYLITQTGHNVVTTSLGERTVSTVEGIHVTADKLPDEINADDIDALIIPGGYSYRALGNPQLTSFLQTMEAKAIQMGAICHGPVLLAEAGVLKGKQFTSNVRLDEPEFELFKGIYQDDDVVMDGPITTATGNAYVEFAFSMAASLGLFKGDTEQDDLYRFFKNTKI